MPHENVDEIEEIEILKGGRSGSDDSGGNLGGASKYGIGQGLSCLMEM